MCLMSWKSRCSPKLFVLIEDWIERAKSIAMTTFASNPQTPHNQQLIRKAVRELATLLEMHLLKWTKHLFVHIKFV